MELYGSLYNISGSVTASAFSGSFIGDGSGLVGIQASGVTGLNLSQIASGDATASITTSGFTVNKNTQIQGNLSVSGALIANEYIVSSSVTYMTTSFASGSSAFGNDNNDVHQFTGSVQITGSISLNGQAIGTGKLDETTFQSYTSSNNTRVSSLEMSTGSLYSFTSSINTTIKSKLDSENVISGSAQVNITGTTGYSTFSSSLATITSGLTSTITSLSSSLTSSIGSLSSSIATTDLNQENRLNALETSSGSLNSFTSSINTTIKSKLNTESVISGSAQVNITDTTGYSTFSSSVATTTSGITSTITMLSSSLTSSIGDLSSSVATTTLNLKNRVDSIETSTGSLNSFTSSINTTIKSKLDTENVISGSVQVNITGTTGYSTFSSSISTSIGSLSSSVATTTSGLTSTITSLSSSVATTTSGLTSTITNLSSSVATTTSGLSSSIGSLSSSVATTTSGLTSTITSLSSSLTSSIGSLSSSVATTTSGLTGTITSLSSSVATTTSGISTTVTNLSSSIATTDLNQGNRITSIEGKTGSYATTGSNVFQGSQTITGSLYISQDLIVAGSSSIQHISSSIVNIADNIITVNAQNPAIRFGGLAVIDSGSSPQVSGSMLFDSTNDQWVFVHQNQTTVTSSILLMGPQTFNNLGGETYPTTNRVLKSVNAEHVGDSNISDNGTTVTILSNTVINGTITSTGTTIVSGSSQIAHDSTTGYAANKHIDHTAVSITAGNGLSGGGDISATRTVSLDTTSATFTSGVKTKMNTDGVISGSSQVLSGTGIWSGSAQLPSGVVSGSSQVSFGGITGVPSGLVSGSSQITFGSISSIPSGLVSGSSQISFGSVSGVPSGLVSGSSQISFGSVSGVPSGLVSGSSQITLSSTTGFGTYLNQAVLTTSTPTFSTVSATTFTGALSGNATTATSTPTLTGSGALTTQSGSGTLIHSYALTAGQTGLFSTSDNSNSIITFNRHPGDYYSQLGFNSTGTIFYRSFNATAINTSQAWKTIIDSSNIGSQTVATAGALSSMNISQFTNNSGYITGITFANVSAKPTTISGYGITDAITTGNIGSQTVASAGNATTAGGFTPSQTSGTANRIVVADANGYIVNNYFNASGGGSERNTSGMGYFAGHNTSDYYYRSYTAAAAAALLSGQSMNISGTATNITAYTINQNVGSSNSPTFAGLSNSGGWYSYSDDDRNPNSSNHYPTSSARSFRFSFVGAGSVGGTGNYGGLLQFNPWDGTSASTGDSSYQLAFINETGLNASGNPGLRLRNGINSTWNSFIAVLTSANYTSYAMQGAGYSANQNLNTSSSPTFANTYVSGVYLRNAAGKGWLSGGYGTYEDSTTTGAIYSIGGSYGPTSTSFSNMHGVGYTHTNSNLLPTGPGTNGWGFYVLTNGTPNVWLGAEGVSWFNYSVLPKTNGGASLGSASYRWANLYTQDLHLSNESKEGGNEIDGTTGNWTIQEGEENLYIINHKNGKKFKIDLTEII